MKILTKYLQGPPKNLSFMYYKYCIKPNKYWPKPICKALPRARPPKMVFPRWGETSFDMWSKMVKSSHNNTFRGCGKTCKWWRCVHNEGVLIMNIGHVPSLFTCFSASSKGVLYTLSTFLEYDNLRIKSFYSEIHSYSIFLGIVPFSAQIAPRTVLMIHIEYLLIQDLIFNLS